MEKRTKRFLIGLPVLLLVGLAVVGVIVYMSNIRETIDGGSASTMVIVSTQDIPPNTKLDPLIEAGDFRTVQVPNDLLVPDAIRSVDQLRGETTSAYILQNEQIPLARLQGIS